MRTKEQYEAARRLATAESDLAYLLDVFGDTLAERNGYKSLNGIDAIHFFVVHKFNWPPAQVRAMSSSDLQFVLLEEMQGWTAPDIALG